MTVSSVADHYGILIQDMADAALVVDAMGRCAAANSAAESLLGFEREKLLGCQISELLVDPAEWLLPDSSCATAVESQARHGDLLIRSGTGKHLALKAWASRLHGTAAGATLLLLHHERERSTAERRSGEGQPPTGTEALSLAKQSLHESEARFRSAFDASSIGMALVSPEGRFLQVNPALCRIVGYTRAELLARTFQEITHPDDIETDRESRKQLLADEITTYQIEKKYLRKSGEVITGRLTASLVRGPEGEPLYFVAQVQDITQFKASGAALREAEARYRTLVEQIPAVVYIDDASALGSPVYVSPRIEPMLGYTPGEWLQPYLWTERLHPDDSERVLAAIAEANRTFRPLDLEYRILARDGRLVWVRDEASLLHDDDGNPQVWHGMMIDITDRKAAEEELRAAKEAAEEASRLKSSILSMATHELRTPLTIISGYVELLAESARENLTPEERDYLEITQNGARTLAALVDDLLDLARIEAGKMDLVIRPVDAGEVIERVRRLVAAQAAAKDLTLEVLIEPGTPKIAADINRLAQILLNIFGNAIKFTTQGSVRGEVRGVAGGVEFSVTDTGIGIAPDAITRIFDEFRQEDSGTTRRFGGTGLGLAIVRRLVDMHHGTISVQSEQGVGSRFALWFPSADPEQFEDDLVPSPDLAITH